MQTADGPEPGTSAPEPSRRRGTHASPRAASRATRQLLMQTAERLFGQHGIEGISLREIGTAAGQSNNNAVQYHFETRENLVASILEWRVTSMEPRRSAMLADLESSGRTSDAKSLLSVLCLPHLDLASADGSYPFARFLLLYIYRYRQRGMPHPFDRIPAQTTALAQTLTLLYRRLHNFPKPLAHFRMTTCVAMFMNALVMSEAQANPFEGNLTQPQMVADVLEMMTTALLAPAAPQP